MAKLSGGQVEQLHNAILGAFSSDELRQLLLTRLDRDLSHISMGSNLKMAIFDIVTQAEREGRTEELLDAVAEARPGRKDLQELCAQLRVVVQQSSTQQSAAPTPEPGSPPLEGTPDELRDALVDAYDDLPRARAIVGAAGIVRGTLPASTLPMRDWWWEAIQTLQRQDKLIALVDVAIADPTVAALKPRFVQLGTALQSTRESGAVVLAAEPAGREAHGLPAAPPAVGTAGREPVRAMVSGADADVKRHLADGEVDAFVGAGISVGAGLPDWYTLISQLAERTGQKMPPREWATGDALIAIAQTYVNRQGLHSLISHLKDRLDTTGIKPTAVHRALAGLPISLVFTANFDNLLERAFRDAGKRVEVVVRDNQIPFMRRGPNMVNIVKLYGDLDQPDTIVLARQQYESYSLQRPELVKLLETELGRATMLYLGWGHSDPHFGLVFGQLLGRYGEFMRSGYAAMFDVPEEQRDELARKQIRLVEFPAGGDRTAQLAAWLEGLGSTP
jgi:hypothetical protein